MKLRKYTPLLALLLVPLVVAAPVHAATLPPLGTAASFGVLAGSTVTNTGATHVVGDVGVSPGTAVVGFPPGTLTGVIHAGDTVALQAQQDVAVAYNNAAGQACDQDLTGQDLGGLTLIPGVYCFMTSAQLTGQLILDGQGNPNAVFIFQIGSTLTTASNSTVLPINGTQPCRIFWQVGSSATLGTATNFSGNILALASITITTGATSTGGLYARTGAVTLDSNQVQACGLPAPTPTSTLVPPTSTPTLVPPTSTPTLTLVPPISTPTITPMPPTSTPVSTPVPPTVPPRPTPIPPTIPPATPVPIATETALPVATETAIAAATATALATETLLPAATATAIAVATITAQATETALSATGTAIAATITAQATETILSATGTAIAATITAQATETILSATGTAIAATITAQATETALTGATATVLTTQTPGMGATATVLTTQTPGTRATVTVLATTTVEAGITPTPEGTVPTIPRTGGASDWSSLALVLVALLVGLGLAFRRAVPRRVR